MSRPRTALLRLAARCCGRLLCALRTPQAPPARGGCRRTASGCPTDVFRGCTPEGSALKSHLEFLYAGTPLFVQPGDTAKWVTFAEIRAAQPEVILQYDCHGCPTAGKYPVAARHGWSALPAVCRDAVYVVSANISDPNLCFPAALEHLVDVLNHFPSSSQKD